MEETAMVTTSARVEKDTMGEVRIPADALWGANTQRALTNLPISNNRMPSAMIRALARIKVAVAQAAEEMGYLPKNIAEAIARAASEIVEGRHAEHFPLDVFQTGSGTSSNMNVNEVAANLANLALGGQVGQYKPVNPNDHVNFGQSSNDAIPSALHLAAIDVLDNQLLPKLDALIAAWDAKAKQYANVIKTGRTHLQDALPITFGHVFGAYVGVLARLRDSLKASIPLLCEIALGGTAVGTGFQAPVGLADRAAEKLSAMLGHKIVASRTPLVYMAGRPAVTDVMGRVAALAAELHRIANDVRMMASGPRLGFGEITIPSLQPGSSIMPGKVNPVVCESVVQVAMAVAGMHATVLQAAAGGQFELNVTLPVTAQALLGSMKIAANACEVFCARLVEGLTVREEDVGRNVNQSLAIVTALISKIGYAEAAKVAYRAHQDGASPAEAAVAMGVLKPEEVNEWLDPAKLVRGGRLG
ncbi:MAG: class II fumarate hydratase [Myxococcales bacterium]|nr:MAG: class II fumarate hydratase [Myxococcales bacterium]